VGKLVILKLGTGNFEQGFPVTMQIGDENARPVVEIIGELPPNQKIPCSYHRWQTIYKNIKLPVRPIGLPKQETPVSTIQECHKAAEELKAELNIWLQSESFRPIREKWLEKLLPSDNVRVLLQTKDLRLQKLPWHLWDLLERYPNTEIALSAPIYEQVIHISPPTSAVKILAILGNSGGIDTQSDRLLMEKLPNADVTFLVEPQRQDLNEQLWGQPWQILFFAGHSATVASDDTGLISINKTENLTISQLKYALKKAVERGLQLAIFNSCDGLGLAREFADLQIPQMIVMREPVPDRVAQDFLKHFLAAFARGESLYLAVREAREKLQGLENHFPCATWLPVIYQNPAQIILTWQELISVKNTSLPKILVSNSNVKQLTKLQLTQKRFILPLALLTSLMVTGLVMGVRYLGILQPLELAAFDQLLRSRPEEKPDSRLLVVNITEEDVAAQAQEKPRGSLSDKSLDKLTTKLQVSQPAVIGLDIYRDYPVGKDYSALAKRMQESDNFLAVCRVTNATNEKPGISPPPEVAPERLGFSNIVLDADNVLRRHYLALTPPPSSSCKAAYALSVQLALRYLQRKGIKLEYAADGAWKLGKLKFHPLETHTGGYQGIDALGHQIFLNYRSSHSLDGVAPKITLTEVLAGKLSPSAIKDKIIIIGTTAESFHDYWLTPYKDSQGNSQSISGVVLQAQMVSQLIGAVLDGRPLLWTWPLWAEAIWIWSWAVTGSLLGCYLQRLTYLGLTGVILIIILHGICLVLLISWGCWVAFIPAVFTLIGSGSIVAAYTNTERRK
jgi:CHASE2 domain-containing sensor protein